jgi:hypothetical protein
MFIVHVAGEFLAPEGRNILPAKPKNISLLRSLKSFLDPRFYKHLVPPGLKTCATWKKIGLFIARISDSPNQ